MLEDHIDIVVVVGLKILWVEYNKYLIYTSYYVRTYGDKVLLNLRSCCNGKITVICLKTRRNPSLFDRFNYCWLLMDDTHSHCYRYVWDTTGKVCNEGIEYAPPQ
jgi:hypothetical protein